MVVFLMSKKKGVIKMIIDCYVFSDVALKPNHTYYNIDDYKLLLYNLKDYRVDSFSIFTFIYKVKVNSDDVHYLGKYGVYSLKYQVVEEVPFGDFVAKLSLGGLEKAGLMSIIKGTMPEDKAIKKYEDILTLNKYRYSLTFIQALKFHAILSQKKYELPILYVDEQGWYLVRLFEYYNRKYEAKNTLSNSTNHCVEQERILGSKKFEEHFDIQNAILANERELQTFYDLIKGRKLTQEKFEQCCAEFMNLLDDDYRKKYLAKIVVFSNYEISEKYKDIFLPEAVFKYPDWIKDLKEEHISWQYADVTRFLMIGYKVKNGNYNLEWANSIMNARSILKNDNYKYIEI